MAIDGIAHITFSDMQIPIFGKTIIRSPKLILSKYHRMQAIGIS